MKKIIAIVGPTASGKTALSIELAKRMNGEIISCDSMQIYKKMNIGTAKPTAAEMDGIVHRMIDIVEPWEEYSCMDYVIAAKEHIDDIISKGKMPIFCGGTGLYIDNVLNDTKFSDGNKNSDFRNKLNEELNEFGAEYIHNKLKDIDPESAEKIHPNNTKRVIRAIEIFYTTGKTKTEWDKESRTTDSPYDCAMIFLDYKDREKLYERINLRVDCMLNEGLEEEAREVLSKTLSFTSVKAIGYKELMPYFEHSATLEECVEKLKRETRRYAKRQLTWFKRDKEIHWLYPDSEPDFETLLGKAVQLIQGSLYG